MTNIRNINSSRSCEALYSVETDFEGFHIVAQGTDINKVREELTEQKARIEVIVLEQCAA